MIFTDFAPSRSPQSGTDLIPRFAGLSPNGGEEGKFNVSSTDFYFLAIGNLCNHSVI